ncbi:exopolysaccharide production protein ExoY [Rhizobium sp. BK376]|nr:exopolysaccharide production protein ExoY [Rhizobium sp. BK376]
MNTSFAVGGLFKRTMDVFLASLALFFILPILIMVALIVKLQDGGPILFVHQRIGFQGRMFGCLKFRTMCCNAEARLDQYLHANPQAALEWKTTQKLKTDPRVTVAGSVLRRLSFDELPQLINVIKGEMSLVGPRPITADELRRYGRDAVYYLAVRPGLTGAWQVSGRNDVSYEERVRLDTDYCKTWSGAKDMNIMLRTLPVLFFRRGSY